MDTVFIREFRVDAWVGVYDWEKQRAQTLEMDIEIGLHPMAHRTENIHDTVNYGEVVERVKKELAERKFRLLEALAEHVCTIILGDFDRMILAMLDGRHTREQLVEEALASVARGDFAIQKKDQAVTDLAEARQVIADSLPIVLQRLAKAALLVE